MNKTEVCIFCRYRRTRADDAAACCAAQEVLGAKPEAADRPAQGAARAMPDRLRQPARQQQRPR